MSNLARYVAASNLPARAKSDFIDRWVGMARGATAGVLGAVGIHGTQAVLSVTEAGGGLITGALAGGMHATVGLDYTVKGHKVPLDALGAFGLVALSIGAARMPGARQAGVMGSQLATIFSFRKVFDYVATQRKAAGKAVGGTFAGDEDVYAAPGFGDLHAEMMRLQNQYG